MSQEPPSEPPDTPESRSDARIAIVREQERKAATDPATRSAIAFLLQKDEALLPALIAQAQKAARIATEQELTQLYKASKSKILRTDHFLNNGSAPAHMALENVGYLHEVGYLGDARSGIYALITTATTAVDISALTPQVIAHMHSAYREADGIAQPDWDKVYAALRQPDDIALYDADTLLRKYLQKIAAQAALDVLGIRYREKGPDTAVLAP